MRYSLSPVIITDFCGETECRSPLRFEVYKSTRVVWRLCVREIAPKKLDSLTELSLVLWPWPTWCTKGPVRLNGMIYMEKGTECKNFVAGPKWERGGGHFIQVSAWSQVNSWNIQGRRTDLVFKYPMKRVLKSLTSFIYLVNFFLRCDCTHYATIQAHFCSLGAMKMRRTVYLHPAGISFWAHHSQSDPTPMFSEGRGWLRLVLAGAESAIAERFQLKINRRSFFFSFSKQ